MPWPTGERLFWGGELWRVDLGEDFGITGIADCDRFISVPSERNGQPVFVDAWAATSNTGLLTGDSRGCCTYEMHRDSISQGVNTIDDFQESAQRRHRPGSHAMAPTTSHTGSRTVAGFNVRPRGCEVRVKELGRPPRHTMAATFL